MGNFRRCDSKEDFRRFRKQLDRLHARDVLRDRAKNIGDGGGEQLQDKVDQLLTLVYSYAG